MKFLSESDLEKFIESVKKSFSATDVCRYMNWPLNGKYLQQVRKTADKYSCDTSHFDGSKLKRFKYKQIEKECPVCGKKFITQEGHKREKITCSHSCSNTYFRSKENNPNWKEHDGRGNNNGVRDEYEPKEYRRVCFCYHEKKCIICGESNIVEVHHVDKNGLNNSPDNLIPLCPTHHKYIHSRHKILIEKNVFEYLEYFQKTQTFGA